MNLTLEQVRDAMGASGDLLGREGIVPARVQTDSRVASTGDLFFCISGDNFDGHRFALDAVRKGACAVVAERPLDAEDLGGAEDLGAPVLMVHSSVGSLGRLAAIWRHMTQARVAGITGTAGKTTVKDLLAHVLGYTGKVHKNQGNLNNQIGLPVSLLASDGDEDFWVLEAGISEARDMDELGAVLAPDLAVLLNVGQAHLEGLGDVRGVAAHKSKLLKHAAELGRGLASADYPELRAALSKVQEGRDISVEYFSVRGARVPYQGRCVEPGGNRFLLSLRGEDIQVELPLPGQVGAENAIAAAAAAHLLGMSPADIQAGFAGFAMPEQRFRPRHVGDWVLVDDSYNANPLSMASALDAVEAMAGKGKLVLALGEMRELGASAGSAHEALGANMAERKAAAVFWSGGHGAEISRGLAQGGYKGPFFQVRNVDEFLALWRELNMDGGVVLFKGSRANRLEELHQALNRELLA